MIVKICGIQTIETAKVAVDAGADLLGFVFANSNRRVTPKQAEAIAKRIPPHIKKVGVFVDETIENMTSIARQVGLDIIQLHGRESPSIASALPYPIIKAFPINELEHSMIHRFPYDYILIDSPSKKYRGGSGKTFNWELVQQLPVDSNKLILAGGLTPENVHEAIEQVDPVGVDVSSGVETDGKKDSNKIKTFIKNVKRQTRRG